MERKGGRFDLLALLAILPFVISSFFIQNKWGSGPPGPSSRSATNGVFTSDLLISIDFYDLISPFSSYF